MVTIPKPAKVFTFAGAYAPAVPAGRLRGDLWRPPSERITVARPDYVNVPWPNGPANGVKARDTIELLLQTHTPGSHVIIYGHSMGAEMIYKWLRDKGPTSTIDPAKVTFVSSGNPENPWTGVCQLRPDDFPTIYGGLGYPHNTPYRLIEVIRQYDFHADHVAARSNKNAMRNIGSQFNCPIHVAYNGIGINDPVNIEWTDPTNPKLTVVVSPTYPLKMLFGEEKKRGKEYVMRRDQELRPGIESAYDRPKAVPLPEYWGEQTGAIRQRRTVACTPSRPTFWAKIR